MMGGQTGRLSLPVILVHGMGGFDQIRMELLARYTIEVEYFRRVAAALRSQGAPEVYTVALPPLGSIEERASALKAFVEQLPESRFHLIAHSMGGLDSRAYITHMQGNARVVSLTTLGTPHRGSALACITADTVIGNFARTIGRLGMDQAVERVLAATAAHRDLRPEACERFNESTPDAPEVAYYSWGGEPPKNLVPWFLAIPHRILIQSADGGPNDGLVTTKSARWTGWRGTVPVDHVGMVGWTFSRKGSSFEAENFYRSLMPDLAAAEARAE